MGKVTTVTTTTTVTRATTVTTTTEEQDCMKEQRQKTLELLGDSRHEFEDALSPRLKDNSASVGVMIVAISVNFVAASVFDTQGNMPIIVLFAFAVLLEDYWSSLKQAEKWKLLAHIVIEQYDKIAASTLDPKKVPRPFYELSTGDAAMWLQENRVAVLDKIKQVPPDAL